MKKIIGIGIIAIMALVLISGCVNNSQSGNGRDIQRVYFQAPIYVGDIDNYATDSRCKSELLRQYGIGNGECYVTSVAWESLTYNPGQDSGRLNVACICFV